MKPYPYKQVWKQRQIGEHRWIMETHVGRRLDRFELVHHINGDKRDNRLENLEIVTPKEHAERHGMQKHPLTKTCMECGQTFTPHPTKRASAKTCSKECRYALLSKINARPDAPRSKYRGDAYPSEVRLRKPSSKA